MSRTACCKGRELYGRFPLHYKAVRGRGSQGVSKCDTPEQKHFDLSKAIENRKYGNKMIAEEFLCGNEITVAVFPNAVSLPVVERFFMPAELRLTAVMCP